MTRTTYPYRATYARTDRDGDLMECERFDFIDVKEARITDTTDPLAVTLSLRTTSGGIFLQMDTPAWRSLAIDLFEQCASFDAGNVPVPNTQPGYDPDRDDCPGSWRGAVAYKRSSPCRACGEEVPTVRDAGGTLHIAIHNTPEV